MLSKTATNNELPTISIILSCYNEEDVIFDKLNNMLELNYPDSKLEILIGSDGSQDRTNEIVRKKVSEKIRFHDFQVQRGKVFVLSDLVKNARNDVFCFTDANTMMNPDCLLQLAKWFNDERIGGVCGKLNLDVSKNKSNQESSYWSYENKIKKNEGLLGVCIGANGANFAIRKEHFPISEKIKLFTDDLVLGLRVLLDGKYFIYEPLAIASEKEGDSLWIEFKRKIRIGRSNLSSFYYLKNWTTKLSYQALFAFISHKIIRWILPVFLLLINVLIPISQNKSYLFMVFGYVFYSIQIISLIAMYLNNKLNLNFPLKKIIYLTLMNIALCIGYLQYLFGYKKSYWESTIRK